MELIPCTPAGQSHWTQRTTLEGVDYVLTFDWNQRAGTWTLDVADVEGDPLASGLVLVARYPLLRGVVDARRPPGELVVLDTQGRADGPGFADLGTRFVLAYATRDEWEGTAAT